MISRSTSEPARLRRCSISHIAGLGGCPFADDELVGNIPTEIVVAKLAAMGIETGIEPWALLTAVEATKEIREQFVCD